MRRAAGVVTQSQRHNSVTRPAAYTAWKGEWMIMHRSDLRTSSIPQRYQRARLLAAASAACLLLMPAIASAQAIGGTVTDSTGGVLPGVTVEARSPALIEQVRTAVTDGNGQYLIIALETGTYSVTFTLPGFSTLIREDVELSTGFTANIDAQMAVGGLEETIIVREANPIIDVQSVRQSETIGREIFELLPTTRGYDSLALLIPAMNIQGGPSTAVPIDTGGVSGRSSNRLTIHGSDEYDSEVNIDGFDAGNVAFEGAPSFQPFDTAIAEYVYDYSSNAAEVETGGVRMNMIPKEGSNRFSGGFYGNFGHSSWLANNVDQDLIDRGITGGKDGAFRSDQSWQLGPSLGGPIVRDRLWFYLSYSYRRASFFPSGLFDNADTSAFTYVPNLDDPTLEASNTQEATGRLTWQATVRDKVQAFFTKNNTFQYPALTGSQLFPIYIAPEAGSEANTTFHAYQLSWTRPQTNRILFEAGFATMPNVSDLFALNNSYGASGAGAHFDARTDLPGIFNAANLTMSRNMGFIFRGSTVHFSRMTRSARASVSYVTGSHNLKVGFTSNLKRQLEAYQSESNWTNIMTYFGSPIRAIYESRGPETNELTNVGIYAQDQWTIDRLTVNAGVRFDYFSGAYPDHGSLPGAATHPVWAGPIIFDGATATSWKDLQPRLGVVYDLAGNGRTAIKASVSRFGNRDAISLAGELNPIANNIRSYRTWTDSVCLDPAVCILGDGLPQGDPLNPEPNGELENGIDNPAFAQAAITQVFDPDWAFGWGVKKANWEFTGSVQHELLENVSVDFGYFRRTYINFDAWDNRAVGPEDFEEFTITVPQDERLPGGGGYDLTLVDIIPEAFGRAQDNLKTSSDQLGGESEMWHGIDLSMTARLEDVLLQGGVATGRRVADYCGLQDQLPELLWGSLSTYPASRAGRGTTGQLSGIAGSRGYLLAKEFCRAEDAWLTNISFSGSYTLPYEIDVSAAFFSRPGPRREAIYTVPAADVLASLERPAEVTRVSMNVLEPGTSFGDRLNQLDVRIAKVLDFGIGGNVRASFDIYNLFNANAVSREQQAFIPGAGGEYLKPIGLQPGRLAKVSFQYNF